MYPSSQCTAKSMPTRTKCHWDTRPLWTLCYDMFELGEPFQQKMWQEVGTLDVQQGTASVVGCTLYLRVERNNPP